MSGEDNSPEALSAWVERTYGPQEPEPKTWSNGVPKSHRKGTGYVYFLLAREGLAQPMVKIGHSRRSRDGRLKDCQTGSPVRLELAAFIYGTRHDERALHARFSEYRTHGEWFRFDGTLREFVEQVANG